MLHRLSDVAVSLSLDERFYGRTAERSQLLDQLLLDLVDRSVLLGRLLQVRHDRLKLLIHLVKNGLNLYWFSVTLSFSVLSLATKSGLKAVFFYLGDQSPRPPGVYRFEAKSEVGKLGGARPPNFASGPGTALGLLPSIALSSDQVSLV